MILVLKPGSTEEQRRELIKEIENLGLKVHVSVGEETTIIGLIGDVSRINPYALSSHEIVANTLRVREPFKKANRMFKPEDTVIDVCGKKIGAGHFVLISGPCSVESEEQIINIARALKEAGATFLRGGAYKPRTSPYSFQGLGLEGLEMLKTAGKEVGLPIVSEIMSTDVLDRFIEDVDIIQVGARNMQNFVLLRELGRTKKPILLKRGLSATLEEWLMSAEYIMSEGNENVILCERGIRTFETYTRNTLDLSAVPAIKKLSHLPIIVDPSHGTGKSWMVASMSKAAVVAGADGLIVEVHNNPRGALSDGEQSLTPDNYAALVPGLRELAEFEGRRTEF
ncbi:MAG TPA: 3-deoxy-7-phosphoheptulonate synthase [Thermoclostridium caenicola]|uniref:3-deoxy-D-arabinoheptulosonate-7-phosphate synthase n=1 Tax=Thermoclostridium caenicola TaxID=659425 RepID=A0A1M6EXF0_9FIRM|nr:3-deoxy-7-phosphoheptulonate synthase [Thermoclostridium caenicola]SHI90108.1 3-deoxy-D-arabinoheptulosonate-7-phosphate synthase [Thermoclostridium caenicola]HOK44050.1 3-deoxy-7-phosphoheptulonate synthase [Thermoclostridium caenicola]HOL83727.1 3-deoxy-7-phosphoheptulonate synthase [Thermoclostridium caenicola]HPO75704.1 3-deoxy-7-phosphoheptulonate synthase [Thermoclostridium caenicola]HPU21834.1 3-deoxy-7-phosphoheptulonate synthase [Thermoclostridium caenicola]